MRGISFANSAGVRRSAIVLALLLAACSHAPPPDFAPDPGLVARIKGLIIESNQGSVCPGQGIAATYYAQLNDGSLVRFEKRYDSKHPPRLHVNFLGRSSADAMALEDGNWSSYTDPLSSAVHGFRVNAFLRANPALNASKTFAPEYSCSPHAFVFEGPPGELEEGGGNGPDVTVRVAVLKSPYVDRLIVFSIQVEQSEPRYVFADANQVPPSDWLQVFALGGHGGPGISGRRGVAGRDGTPGCPGTPGGAGGAGGNGGPGAPGGRGGRVTIVVPDSEPFLAGLIDAQTPGGHGGASGQPGPGGAGGKGGAARPLTDRRCVKGADGAAGPSGRPGLEGQAGTPGYRPRITAVPADQVFGAPVPAALAELMQYRRPGPSR